MLEHFHLKARSPFSTKKACSSLVLLLLKNGLIIFQNYLLIEISTVFNFPKQVTVDMVKGERSNQFLKAHTYFNLKNEQYFLQYIYSKSKVRLNLKRVTKKQTEITNPINR